MKLESKHTRPFREEESQSDNSTGKSFRLHIYILYFIYSRNMAKYSAGITCW